MKLGTSYAIINQFRLPVSIFHDCILVWGKEPKVIKPKQEIEGVDSITIFDRNGNVLKEYTKTQEDNEIRKRTCGAHKDKIWLNKEC